MLNFIFLICFLLYLIIWKGSLTKTTKQVIVWKNSLNGITKKMVIWLGSIGKKQPIVIKTVEEITTEVIIIMLLNFDVAPDDCFYNMDKPLVKYLTKWNPKKYGFLKGQLNKKGCLNSQQWLFFTSAKDYRIISQQLRVGFCYYLRYADLKRLEIVDRKVPLYF